MILPSPLLCDLQTQIRRLERSGIKPQRSEWISSGFRALDRLLGGGFASGTLVEWSGTGPLTLALAVGGRVAGRNGTLAFVGGQRTPFPPALAGLGVPLERTIVIRPPDANNALWAWEQALQCEALAVTIGRMIRTSDSALRRLQLAVETGGGLGFLICSSASQTTTWAKTRLRVQALPGGSSSPLPSGGEGSGVRGPGGDDSETWRFRVELLRWRTGAQGSSVELEVGREIVDSNPVSVAAQLARAEGQS